MLGSKRQLKRYLKCLLEHGVDINKEVDAYYSSKGLRFGNSQKETTEVCCLMPIYVGGVKRRYDADPVWQTSHGEIGHGGWLLKKVRYGANLQWEDALMGKKGEYVIRLTKDFDTCQNARVEEVLLPQDFWSHMDIYNKLPLSTITANGPLFPTTSPRQPSPETSPQGSE